MDGPEFDAIIRGAPTPEARLAWFAALLAREARTYVEVVGGSAVEIYLSSEMYVSQDVDLVGNRPALAEVLRRWGFAELEGRSRRIYWFKGLIGLVDLVGPVARSGLPAHRLKTPYGPVMLSAREPLILRRLVRAEREDSEALFQQAVRLAQEARLDWEYLEAVAKFERVRPSLERLRKAVRPKKRKPRRMQ